MFNAVLQKKLGGLLTLPYSERLGLTGLEQLEARRIRADLIFTYIVIWSHLSRRPRLFLNF